MQTKKHYPNGIKKASLLVASVFLAATLMAQPMENSDKGHVPVKKTASVVSPLSFNVDIMDVAENNYKFVLSIENPLKKRLFLTISHAVQGDAYRKEIREEKYMNRFDFSQAEDGLYTLTITCGKERYIKQINLNTSTEETRILSVE